jgi:glutathione S-transferase
MKFYDSAGAPNPRRVSIFLAEKGIDVPKHEVSIAKGEHRSDAYLAKNPLGQVPILELDDGTVIAESNAICRYFEETHPEPPLFGSDALDRARVAMWDRRAELSLFLPYANVFRNTHSFFKDRITQVPEYGELNKKAVAKGFDLLDAQLADNQFLAGSAYTIADITAQCALDFFGRILKILPGDDHKHMVRWYEAVSARPSAQG